MRVGYHQFKLVLWANPELVGLSLNSGATLSAGWISPWYSDKSVLLSQVWQEGRANLPNYTETEQNTEQSRIENPGTNKTRTDKPRPGEPRTERPKTERNERTKPRLMNEQGLKSTERGSEQYSKHTGKSVYINL